MNRARFHERGAAMIVALVSLTVVTVFSVTVLTTVVQEGRGVNIDFDRAQALKIADGLSDIGEQGLVHALANFIPFVTPPANKPWLVLTGSYTVGNIEGAWDVSRATMIVNGNTVPVPSGTEVDPISGLTRILEYYEIESIVQHRTSRVRVSRQVRVNKIPIFQFLAFYDDDLEILPGPAMSLNGRVHSNGDMFLAPGTSLTIDSKYLRTAGALYKKRKDSTALPTGWIRVRDAAVGGPLDTLWSKSDLTGMGIGSINGLDSRFTGWDINGDFVFNLPGEMDPFKSEVMQIFNGSVQSGEHGVFPIAHPQVGSLQPYESFVGGNFVAGPIAGQYLPVPAGTGTHREGYFHDNAGLVVIGNNVYDTNGNNITALMPATFRTTQTVWDQREGKWSTTTRLNMSRLWDMDGVSTTLDPSPYRPINGLIYATRTEATSSTPNGITISAGSQINIPDIWNSNNYGGSNPTYPGAAPAGAYAFGPAENVGITVVSNCPVYVHGNFNTVNKKPSSVITDTISLLSNSWNFTKGPNQTVTASNTTYNLAMITGNKSTTVGAYNGGFENLPRFHENWTGKSATIVGSFVNAWRSQIAIGAWVYGGAYYSAPNRNWSYDTTFDSGNLPPFTPMVIETDRLSYEMSL
ncbi:MAG: hypothetical protein EXS14_10550 [Planctomycetes bacterium]|nr:hypothetical protein [Planctomycetota bacterium]